MGQAVRFQEILRRLAIIDEGFVEDQAGLGLGLPGSRLLDPKTAALVQVGGLVAIGLRCRQYLHQGDARGRSRNHHDYQGPKTVRGDERPG
jgi:hypothetical protein